MTEKQNVKRDRKFKHGNPELSVPTLEGQAGQHPGAERRPAGGVDAGAGSGSGVHGPHEQQDHGRAGIRECCPILLRAAF